MKMEQRAESIRKSQDGFKKAALLSAMALGCGAENEICGRRGFQNSSVSRSCGSSRPVRSEVIGHGDSVQVSAGRREIKIQLDDVSVYPANEAPSAILSVRDIAGNVLYRTRIREGCSDAITIDGNYLVMRPNSVAAGYSLRTIWIDLSVYICPAMVQPDAGRADSGRSDAAFGPDSFTAGRD